MKRNLIFLSFALLFVSVGLFSEQPVSADRFSSSFETTPDRVWPGRSYWPNPMENWRVRDGRLECTSNEPDRNLHLLTHTIGDSMGDFSMSVRLGRIRPPGSGSDSSITLDAGASLEGPLETPNVKKRSFTIKATVSEWGDGVLLSHGGAEGGYVLYVDDGKPVFAVRNQSVVNQVSAKEAIEEASGTLTASLTESGKAILKWNGNQLAEGMVGNLVQQPSNLMQVGRDGGSPVGSYSGERPFQGKIKDVSIALPEKKRESGSSGAGFSLGVQSSVRDYRAGAFAGNGLEAIVTTDGRLRLGTKTVNLPDSISFDELRLRLEGKQAKNGQYNLTLSVRSDGSDEPDRRLSLTDVEARTITGSVRLVSNPDRVPGGSGSSFFWFQNWQLEGDAVTAHPDRAFGPILWSMYTLHNHKNGGHLLKMSVQLPPLGKQDRETVELQIKKNGTWETVETAQIDPFARNAIFREPDWPAERDVRYRVVYETRRTDGETVRDTWRGTIRREPRDHRNVSIADLNCQVSYSFPYEPVVKNVSRRDPDLLFFAGDQLYEGNGGYGLVRRPAENAIVSYLRKFYMFGWAFRDVMRNRPTICVPDDHDVFQGNIWGEGGKPMEGTNTGIRAGYIEPVRTVNAIYRTQTGHHPGVQNLLPSRRGIRVFYGDLLYGGLSMAILGDRQFKSGPHHVDSGPGRLDIMKDPNLDPERLDQPGLRLLGKRQLSFLKDWVRDWREAEMKVLLSQTTFSNPMTHTGPNRERVYADLDSNAWPQSKRDLALRVLRKGFVFHLAGDQHLPTLVHHGIEKQRDSLWTFVAPAISVGWPRWFVADEVGLSYRNRPDHQLPNTGAYEDGFQNKMYVYAVGNPPVKDVPQDAPEPYRTAHRKASGFGVATFDVENRTITTESYKFYGGLSENEDEGNQFPGWPKTVKQQSNYGRDRAGHLPEVSIEGVEEPVVKLFSEGGELIYAIRSKTKTFRPFVFEPGTYEVRVGSPEQNRWKTVEDLTVTD